MYKKVMLFKTGVNLIPRVFNSIKSIYFRKNYNNFFDYRITRIMDELIHEINSNHIKIMDKIQDLEKKIEISENLNKNRIKKVLTEEEIETEKQRLIKENNEMKLEINRLVNTLNGLESKRDKNIVLNSSSNESKPEVNNSAINESKPLAEKSELKPTENKTSVEKKPKKEQKKEPKTNEKKANPEDNQPIDVSRLDLRVGRIVSAKRHPDADSLYVEEIDCGEEKPRTVVSGLVRYVPLEEMTNRLVIVLCNLKPAKMRGITSEAMVMCASSPESVQILDPPEGSQPGDRISFDKYPGTCDPLLNPKKKIWEQIAPDLKTNGECVATYKGEPFKVGAKGVVTAKSLANVVVK